GDDPTKATEVHIHGVRQWRCLRIDRWDYFITRPTSFRYASVDGTRLSDCHDLPFLTEFCSKPLPDFVPIEIDNKDPVSGHVVYRLASSDVGVRSAHSWFMSYQFPNDTPRFRSESSDVVLLGAFCAMPYKRLLLDVFLHKD